MLRLCSAPHLAHVGDLQDGQHGILQLRRARLDVLPHPAPALHQRPLPPHPGPFICAHLVLSAARERTLHTSCRCIMQLRRVQLRGTRTNLDIKRCIHLSTSDSIGCTGAHCARPAAASCSCRAAKIERDQISLDIKRAASAMPARESPAGKLTRQQSCKCLCRQRAVMSHGKSTSIQHARFAVCPSTGSMGCKSMCRGKHSPFNAKVKASNLICNVVTNLMLAACLRSLQHLSRCILTNCLSICAHARVAPKQRSRVRMNHANAARHSHITHARQQGRPAARQPAARCRRRWTAPRPSAAPR